MSLDPPSGGECSLLGWRVFADNRLAVLGGDEFIAGKARPEKCPSGILHFARIPVGVQKMYSYHREISQPSHEDNNNRGPAVPDDHRKQRECVEQEKSDDNNRINTTNP